ncbi:MAG: GNAT family N-acetyltransferase [bacterium]
MPLIQIKKVENKSDLKKFIMFPYTLYKNEQHWVPPLISEIEKFLDRGRGPFFEIGEAEYFLAFINDEVVGRISAHINHQWNNHFNDQKGFYGFFESIDNLEVSNLLFSTAEQWLKNKGSDGILGPLSFSIYDEVALLVDGFDSDPAIMQAYNPPYYINLTETYGFKKTIDWYAYLRTDQVPLRPTFLKIRERTLNQTGVKIRNINMKKFDQETKIIQDIFNSAWSDNWGHLPLTDKQFNYLIENLKFLIDPRIVFIVEKDTIPIGFSISIPDANPALKKAKGHLYPFGIIKIMGELKKIKKLRTLILGVKKEYRGKGIDIVLLVDTIQGGIAAGYKESDCSLIAENNIPIRKAMESIGAEIYRTYRLYEKPI